MQNLIFVQSIFIIEKENEEEQCVNFRTNQNISLKINQKKMLGRLTNYGPTFPELEKDLSTCFAHDLGDMITVNEIRVGGKTISDRYEILSHIIDHRNGWSHDGKSTDDIVKQVAYDFVKMEYGINNLLDKPWTSEEISKATKNEKTKSLSLLSSVPVEEPEPSTAIYHPLEKSIIEYNGDKVVRIAYWTKRKSGDGPRGGPPFTTKFMRVKHEFYVKNGKRVHVGESPATCQHFILA